MPPSTFGRHQWIAGQILSQFNQQLQHQACSDCFALVETDWIVAQDTVVRPDIAIVCGRFPEQYINSAPRVVVEVLSESTQHKDRTAKFDLYQREGVHYYIMIDSQGGGPALYGLDETRRYQALPASGTIALQLHNDCTIELSL